MLLISKIMGCGRSKQRSSNMSKEDGLQDGPLKENPNGKKKKQHVEKENSGPTHAEVKPDNLEHFPEIEDSKHTSPRLTNGSNPHTLHLNVDFPHFIDKRDLSPTHCNGVNEFAVPRENIKVTHSQIEFFKMLDEKNRTGQRLHK